MSSVRRFRSPRRLPATAAARSARARPLQNVARILAVVLERAREIGVTGAGAGDLTPPLSGGRVGLGGHDVLPVLPVTVPHQHRDGRAQRLTRAYAGEPFEDSHQAAPVRLTGGGEAEGHGRR